MAEKGACEKEAQAIKRDMHGRIAKGSVLNPRGRPKGNVNAKIMEKLNAAALDVALPKLIALAKSGDREAIKLLFLAGIPKVKAVTPLDPVKVSGADSAEKVQSILDLIAKGEISKEHAEILLSGIEMLLKANEQEKLNDRIEALEHKGSAEQKSGVLIVPGMLEELDWIKATEPGMPEELECEKENDHEQGN